jgi:putative glutamine amidotransferase
MSIRIAIPEPTSFDTAYNQRALPQYLAALHSAGLTPIPVPLHESPQRIAKILSTTVGVLLPGSGADVDSQKYGEARDPHSEDPDQPRAAADELLIQDAFNLHKPILAICHGAQALNVWCGGTLIQDIPSQVAPASGGAINHAPGREVLDAHALDVARGSRLASLIPQEEAASLKVNSSHHQAIRTPGDNLVITATCPIDHVIEAVELASSGPEAHWVLAVQWHPERTYLHSHLSRNIFAAFAHAAEQWTPRKIEESVLQA